MHFDLNILRDIYCNNENLIQYMRAQSGSEQNTVEQIMLSYDFQAGSYIENYLKAPASQTLFLRRLAKIIEQKGLSGAMLEAGVGEATSLVPLLELLQGENGGRFHEVYAFDISWSRIKVAKEFSASQGQAGIHFFTGDLLNIPLVDNYFDLVYTIHAVEPNGGKEKDILQELYRVCRNCLILLEPCYELAGSKARERMEKHGYITSLQQAAKELNYLVETYELYGISKNPLNPTGLMIIQKDPGNVPPPATPYACPVSKKPMKEFDSSFYCPDSMFAYPMLQGIPCLATSNAIVATKFLS